MSAKEEFCSVGLLAFATEGNVNGNVGECGDVLAEIIKANYPERVGDSTNAPAPYVIMRFNDHADTTFGDVERMFEKAEVAWDERI